MKIVIFGPAYPFRGGVPHFTAALRKTLIDAGHEVALVNFRNLFPRIFFPGKSQLDDSPRAIPIESERVFVPWKPWTWKRTARAIAAHKPDLILAMWWQPSFGPAYRGVIRALPEDYRKRLTIVLHDVVSHERFPGDRILARRALKTASHILALSEAEAGVFKSLVPEFPAGRIHVAVHPRFDSYQKFPGSVQDARRALGVTAKKVLLFFGFVRNYKGLDLLLRAMPQILRADPDLQLLICGPFHEKRESYDKLIGELGIEAAVRIHDRYFSGDDVSVCFAAADVVVLPYRSATQSGVVPLCYALDAPVIATRVGALTETVQHGITGYLVPPGNPEILADAVLKFYAAGGRHAFQSGLRAEAAKYGWEPFIARLEKIRSQVN